MNTNAATYYGDKSVKKLLLYSTRCLNCGGDVETDQAYCCKACYETKPPKMAWIEKEYKTPIRELLLNFLNNHSESFVADYLGITPWTLYHWKKKQGIKKVVRYE